MPAASPSAAKSRAQSIWVRLIVGLVAVSLLAAAATSLLIYERFVATNSAFRDRTLQNDARVISKLLRRAAEGRPLQLPDFLADGFQQGKGKFAIVSEHGVLLAGSAGVTGALAPIDEADQRDFFLTDGGSDGPKLYGFTLHGTYGSKPVWIQVAVPQGEIAFDSVLEEFIKDIGWIWVPFIIGLLGTNLLVARIGLRPLQRAAAQAEAIGPGAVSARLPEEGLPREVHALVGAVNRALDRLEIAFQSQQRFIADAAHELRTPVAVLKAHAHILPEHDGLVAWKQEIDAMQRLVDQLLDSARLDVVALEKGQVVELNEVARAVAAQLAPIAVGAGKSIEVAPSSGPVIINGSTDLLAGALRNLVENAIRHTAPGTAVLIEISLPATLRVSDHGPGIDPQERELIFKRFWQGGRDRGGGAGLGMDIVARSVAALGGSISISDAPGGAAFILEFQPASPTEPAAREIEHPARERRPDQQAPHFRALRRERAVES
jgi:signal transduction histidine kinase